MPELPEVETVRRGLAPVMEGVAVARLIQRRPDLRFPFPERFAECVEGRRILKLRRRAKYLLADIDGGDTLVMHLGMSGRFLIAPPVTAASAAADGKVNVDNSFRHGREGGRPRQGSSGAVGLVDDAGNHQRPSAAHQVDVDGRLCGHDGKSTKPASVSPGAFLHEAGGHAAHDHVTFHMTNGATITYNDARRFGFMLLIPTVELEAHALFAGIGIEPLGGSLTPAYLAARAHGRKTDLKAFLLDQRHIAGLGNIYVSEALHRARLRPTKPASVLAMRSGAPTPHAVRLVPEIKAVLEAALQAGGSTLRDFRHADGALGYFQHRFAVYDRAGEPCAHAGCAGTIKRIVQAGRSTFYCPSCQR